MSTASIAPQIRRKLPGKATLNPRGEITFMRGYVTYASPRVQWVETDSKEYRLVALIGETYIYWCPRCSCTVWEQELMMLGARTCPFCAGTLQNVLRGDKIRLHYRYDPKALSWGNWWGERWEW
jgi:hypothetical protein